MRIGIFDPYLDDVGGGEKYMMSAASILSEKHQVAIFWDNEKDLQLVQERFGIDGSKFTLAPNVFKPSISTLKRFLFTRKYDAIIVLSDGSIPLVGAKKLYIHIQQPLESLQGSVVGKIKISRVNKFFCNSYFTKSFIDKKFHLSSEVIYPPVLIPENVSKNVQKKENIILHVGRFRAKNVENGDFKKQSVMIETFKHMIDKGFKNWKFILAVSIGEKDKDLFETMKKSVRSYPIEFLINQRNDSLWDIYEKSKIYWHASGYGENLTLHPELAEHFGISTVEAMGAGVVPVVINAGGQKEIVQNNENGFLWNTLDELQKYTLEIVTNEKLRQKLSKKAQETSQKFGYGKFKQSILNLIK